jgi:2,6-dihydroxypseudooxynicotine hydrolase
MTTSTTTSTDPRIQAAVAHWAVRLIANGIDYNDFQATTARIARWEDWSVEWSKTAATHEEMARQCEQRGSPISAADAYVRAAICHHFGKFVFFEDMKQYKAADAATVANYPKAMAHLDPPAQRVAIPYAGTTLPGYLRIPKGASRPPVAMIVCGLDSVKEEMNTFEPLFHRRGLATLCFDGPGQGESEKLPIEPHFEKVMSAALDWLEQRDDVDGKRVAAVGISLGGYYLARAAAFERRLKGAAPIGGPYDFGGNFDSIPSISKQAFQFRSHSPDLATAKQRALMLDLKDVAQKIEIPLLVVFGKKDRLIPYQQAERLFAEASSKDKRLVMYPEGNHVCNNMPFAYRPLVADWIAEHLR